MGANIVALSFQCPRFSSREARRSPRPRIAASPRRFPHACVKSPDPLTRASNPPAPRRSTRAPEQRRQLDRREQQAIPRHALRRAALRHRHAQLAAQPARARRQAREVHGRQAHRVPLPDDQQPQVSPSVNRGTPFLAPPRAQLCSPESVRSPRSPPNQTTQDHHRASARTRG